MRSYLQDPLEHKQKLLRQAYKLATEAEAKNKILQQQLDDANTRCR